MSGVVTIEELGIEPAADDGDGGAAAVAVASTLLDDGAPSAQLASLGSGRSCAPRSAA